MYYDGGKKPKIGSWKYWNNIAYGDILELGSLRSYDGNCKENVALKLNFALS